MQTETSHRTIGGGRALSLLAAGTIELEGQVPWSSNYTFLVTVRSGEDHALAIYKPTRGERPLWDFGEGTLCHREVAAFRLSDALGWPNIPPTVLCDGPYGRGSLQLYIDAEFEEHFFSLRERGGFDPAFREIALFDCLVNNADRKGGHVLLGPDGRIWSIDHGLTFHVEYKVRTVIWDYADEPLTPSLLADLRRTHDLLGLEGGALREQLLELLSFEELSSLLRRFQAMIKRGRHPMPLRDWRNVPYPLV